MPDSETLSHTMWDGKYRVVFIPKYRRKALYHALRWHLGEVLRASVISGLSVATSRSTAAQARLLHSFFICSYRLNAKTSQ